MRDKTGQAINREVFSTLALFRLSGIVIWAMLVALKPTASWAEPPENTITPMGIVIHHSALSVEDFAQFPGPTDAAVIDALHEKRGFGTDCSGHIYHIGYHYVILSSGKIQTGRPENCLDGAGRTATLYGLCTP